MTFMLTRGWFRIVALAFLLGATLPACADEDSVQQRGSALEAAMWNGDIQKARNTLDKGSIPARNSEGLCWIQAAVTLKQPSLIKPLVDEGVSVDCKDTRMTALQYAITNRRYRAAEELIKLGGNVNVDSARNDDGDVICGRPLNEAVSDYLAIRYRQMRLNSQWHAETGKEAKRVIHLLLANGADPNLLDDAGRSTALSISAQLGQTEVVRWLLEAGANPNQLSNAANGGATAIETAIFNNTSNIATVQALLNAGADPTVGPHADTLLDKAKKNMPKVVPLLEQYGAQ